LNRVLSPCQHCAVLPSHTPLPEDGKAQVFEAPRTIFAPPNCVTSGSLACSLHELMRVHDESKATKVKISLQVPTPQWVTQ
jgi:hypothetical protein